MRRMNWLQLTMASARMAVDAQFVIAARLTKLAQGGPDAAKEASLMINEKLMANAEAAMSLATGATPLAVVRAYGRKVSSNRRRLTP